MKLSNKTYDILAFVGRVVLPALSILFATLAEIWGLSEPFTKQIPLTITALDLFLNSLLGISTANYYKDALTENDKKMIVEAINNFDTVNPDENFG